MNFNNNPYNNPYGDFLSRTQPVHNQPQPQSVIRVNGKGGADAYILPPNSSILMLDNTQPLVWLKTTDGAGFPTVTAYNCTPVTEPQSAETSDLEKRLEALEKNMEELKNVKQQSDVKPVATPTPTTAVVVPTATTPE